MKRVSILAGLTLLSAAPSLAQEPTTLQYLLAKGVVIHAEFQGQPIDLPVTYSSDGTSSMKFGGRIIGGTWRVDGDKFCAANEVNLQESCFVIPTGKKPGDAFKTTTPAMGEVTITINE